MKTLVVEASPRREGNSITIAGSFMRGLRDSGETQIREYVLNDIVHLLVTHAAQMKN